MLNVTKYEYEDGLLVKKIFEENGKEDYVTINYSEDNKIQTWVNSNNEVTRIKRFDDNGNLIAQEDGLWRWEYEYDEQNRLIKYSTIDINNDAHNICEITTYDDTNNTAKKCFSGETSYSIDYYDDKNRIIKNESYNDANSEPHVINYKYNDLTNTLVQTIIETDTDSNAIENIEITKFKKFANREDYIPVAVLSSSGIDIIYQYEFDQDGNIVCEKEIVNN